MDQNNKRRDSIEQGLTYNPGYDHLPSVRIATKFQDGKFIRLQDKSEIVIPDGTMVDLIIYKSYFEEKSALKKLNQKEVVPFLPAGTTLYFAVSRRKVTRHLSACLQWEDWMRKLATIDASDPLRENYRKIIRDFLWVEMSLMSDVKLILQADRPGRLKGGHTRVPYFDMDFSSINSAVSYILKSLMPERPTNTANVFLKVACELGDDIILLEDHRTRVFIQWDQSRVAERAASK